MDKEEILAKNQEENRSGDERDQEIANQASMYGFIGMSAGYILMLLLEVFLKGRAGFGYIFLFSVFLASTGYSRYKLGGSRVMLLGTICWTACAVVWLVLYLWKG